MRVLRLVEEVYVPQKSRLNEEPLKHLDTVQKQKKRKH